MATASLSSTVNNSNRTLTIQLPSRHTQTLPPLPRLKRLRWKLEERRRREHTPRAHSMSEPGQMFLQQDSNLARVNSAPLNR